MLSSFPGFLKKGNLYSIQTLFLLLSLLISNVPSSQANDFDFESSNYYFDFLTFKAMDGENIFLEIFCQIPTQELLFTKTLYGVHATYSLAIALYDLNENQVANLDFTDSIKVNYDDITGIDPSHLIRFTFNVKPDAYIAKVKFLDLENLSEFSFRKNLKIPNYYNSGLQLSDIQLASSVTFTNENSELVKNNKKVIPNVSHIFGTRYNTLYAYSEVYNLSHRNPETQNKFRVVYTIVDRDGHQIKKITYEYDKPDPACAFSAAIPVNDLQAGQYKLIMSVQDLDNLQTTTEFTYFQIIRSPSKYVDAEFTQMLNQLKYFLPDQEISYLRLLSADKRTSALQELFAKMDPDPDTPENEFLIEFFRRLYYTNQTFQSQSDEGWKTDQGKIYVKNGAPDFIDRQVADGAKTYEIWSYNNLNRKYVFVDEWGLGGFQLLKSEVTDFQ